MHAPANSQTEDFTTHRAEELFRAEEEANYRRTDRMFAWLMAIQWLAGIAAALWISPGTIDRLCFWKPIYKIIQTPLPMWGEGQGGGTVQTPLPA